MTTKTKNLLLQAQLNLIASHCIKSKSDLSDFPQLYAVCPKCDQPTPQLVSLNEKKGMLSITYPCVNSKCPEARDE